MSRKAPVLERTSTPSDDDYQRIGKALLAFNEAAVGDATPRPFAVLVRDPDTGEVIGGLWGKSVWGSFFVDTLALPDAVRGLGLGQTLMADAEAEARRRGCHNLWLDTFAFQARPFYERLGFRLFGQIDGPAPMFPRFFMVKALD
ncbi:GNAT family N-acetyltransferase [Phenylobacterium aquaticum]|uniref:GNAT family N-acetyltransferase n=1 Tax=Phenylobacterium aquaticum TaxID=1763816 RepID=UPI0026F232A7|nr:GNAT family N-acetyltransferase [Phenylobacterium aquaticum]